MTAMPLDETGERWWIWAGHTVDLAAESGQVPGLVRVALLARRDAENAEDTDMADFLAWLVKSHPPWFGGCPTCGTPSECSVQANASPAVVAWLGDRARRYSAASLSRPERKPDHAR